MAILNAKKFLKKFQHGHTKRNKVSKKMGLKIKVKLRVGPASYGQSTPDGQQKLFLKILVKNFFLNIFESVYFLQYGYMSFFVNFLNGWYILF